MCCKTVKGTWYVLTSTGSPITTDRAYLGLQKMPRAHPDLDGINTTPLTSSRCPANRKSCTPPCSTSLRLLFELSSSVRLQLVTVNPSISLNVTLFRLPESHKLGPHVATSGPYSHSAAGVAVGPQLLTAGSYVIIPSTFDAGVLTSYKLIVYSSTTTILVNPITL